MVGVFGDDKNIPGLDELDELVLIISQLYIYIYILCIIYSTHIIYALYIYNFDI